MHMTEKQVHRKLCARSPVENEQNHVRERFQRTGRHGDKACFGFSSPLVYKR